MEHEKYTPFKNIDELWERIGDNCFHPKKSDILDIPDKVYNTYRVELTKEQKELYLQLQNQHCTDRIVVDNGLKLYLRFQDICNGYEPVETDELNSKGQHKVELIPLKENPKLDVLCEIIEEIGTEQIVVWCSRSRLLHDACAYLQNKGYTCGIYDGKVGTEAREEAYEAFFNKQIQIILINQASGAYGLDKLRNADYAVYLCNDSSVEKRQQSEDRIDRGQHESRKFIYDITCEGTVEQKVNEALLRGEELVSSGITDASVYMYYGG
jgi:SNF2 family DNA or RNA helicase